MSSYSKVQDHRLMVFDDLRNNYYSEAIKNAVNKDSVVLDLGAGLGLHGLMAASNGARKVYLVEPSSIIDIAKQLTTANNVSEQVECLPGKIEEVELPEKVDTAYTWSAIQYVERNPIRAGLVENTESYHWSSTAGHCELVDDPLLISLQNLKDRSRQMNGQPG